MNPTTLNKPRVFVDADVLFTGSSTGLRRSGLVILQLAEITLIEAATSCQVITEAERNLPVNLPQALPTFR